MFRSRRNEPWMGPLPAAAGCDCQICRPEDSYDAVDQNTIDTVLRHGWQVMAVSDEHDCEHHDHNDEDLPEVGGGAPSFAYTIGLGHRQGHPELMMSGLSQQLMHS